METELTLNGDSTTEDLVESIRSLINAVESLEKRIDTSEEALKIESTWRKRLSILTVFSVILAIFVGIGWYNNRETLNKVNTVVELALCPFFALVEQSYNPQSVPEKDREAYVQNFGALIHIKDDVLKCGG